MSAESAILLEAARAQVHGDRRSSVGQFADGPIDWDELQKLAVRHKMLPLVYRNLDQKPTGIIPAEAMKGLKAAFTEGAAWNLVLIAELRQVIKLFEANDIPVIPHKGPLLATMLYGNPALRQCSDLDLLIRKSDLDRARSILISDGYVPAVPLDSARRKAFLLSECDETFVRSSVGVMLELHWAIVPPYYRFPQETEGLFERAQRKELSGLSVLVPSLDDLLLMLSVNASKEMWGCLEWTCGIAVIAQRLTPHQWERALEEARRLGVERVLLLGLRLAQQLVGCELPLRVARSVESGNRIDLLARKVMERLFGPGRRLGELTRFRLAVRERWQDRVKYCWLRALRPTHRDARVVKLPASLFFVYYLIRPFRLLGSATRTAREH
jgi:hypothetical protein